MSHECPVGIWSKPWDCIGFLDCGGVRRCVGFIYMFREDENSIFSLLLLHHQESKILCRRIFYFRSKRKVLLTGSSIRVSERERDDGSAGMYYLCLCRFQRFRKRIVYNCGSLTPFVLQRDWESRDTEREIFIKFINFKFIISFCVCVIHTVEREIWKT